jgi:hemerythrin-like metal-binding protein
MNTPHIEALHWNEALALDIPAMDDTHKEFVMCLSAVVNADDAQLMPAWNALLAHTQAHFDQEDAWMLATGFAAGNCHATQHKVILQVMREGQSKGEKGEIGVVRQMAHELGLWFPQHAESMDASLAAHLQATGFDPATGAVHAPQALPAEAIQGCGGATCADPA